MKTALLVLLALSSVEGVLARAASAQSSWGLEALPKAPRAVDAEGFVGTEHVELP